ncbi:hypothetical protein SNE40_022233 [Patella caerulea]|uniref:Pleckstrin homology domain-containing family A member 8 n=1 Tax=Patella caerulea TaxID=87958 RepID=A0AAN8GFN3_PATCE
MEGVLWKWTNYLSGWQPRWFVLDNGILSYYKSQEDVNNGCKGSIKMSACDISVHQTDHSRIDLIIPGEQRYYVKAANSQERQEWLVALGSSKAAFNSSHNRPESGELSPDIIKSKKSELRLYCDFLMQQVHSVKQIVKAENGPPDEEKLTEASHLLGATCDTFIQTLEDCMKLVSTMPVYEMPHQHVTDSAIPPSPSHGRVRRSSSNKSQTSRPSSVEKQIHIRRSSSSSTEGAPPPPSTSTRPRTVSDASHSDTTISEHSTKETPRTRTSLSESNAIPEQPTETLVTKEVNSSNIQLPPLPSVNSSEDMESPEDFQDAIDPKLPTFFSSLEKSFSDIDLTTPDGIIVQDFLSACQCIVPLFDKLNGTAFAPVKMDFAGNIRKMRQKYSTDPAKFETLQKMVLFEVQAKQHTNSNSATVALLWMKRGLEFIREILREINSGEMDLTLCASNAYNRTLKNYHGWVVRGVFAVATKALPYREVFLAQLATTECDTNSQIYAHSVQEDIESYVKGLNNTIKVIDHFYKSNNLDDQEQI